MDHDRLVMRLTPDGHHRDGKINGIDVTGEVR